MSAVEEAVEEAIGGVDVEEAPEAIRRPSKDPKYVARCHNLILSIFPELRETHMGMERKASPAQKLEWRDGKTRFTLGDSFYLEMANRVQVRYTHELPDSAVQLPGTHAPASANGPSSSSLTPKRHAGRRSNAAPPNWPQPPHGSPTFRPGTRCPWRASRKSAWRFSRDC